MPVGRDRRWRGCGIGTWSDAILALKGRFSHTGRHVDAWGGRGVREVPGVSSDLSADLPGDFIGPRAHGSLPASFWDVPSEGLSSWGSGDLSLATGVSVADTGSHDWAAYS